MNILFFTLSFVLWAAIHSLTASLWFKNRIRIRIGQRAYDGLYRFFYNVVSVITFLPVLVVAGLTLPDQILWSLPPPVTIIFILIQVAGMVGLLISLHQTDAIRFAGIDQLIRYLKGEEGPRPKTTLVISGSYKIVRHPLYFFSLLVIWFVPVMTWHILLFNLAATVYFWIGSGYEERRLVAEFGDEYRQYQRRVPRLLPIKVPGSDKSPA